MTLIIALRKDNEVWLAADSFWGNNRKYLGFSDFSKIVEFKSFSIGIHGDAIFRDAAEELIKSYKGKIEDKQDARNFARVLFAKIKELTEASLEPEKKEFTGGFIICTKTKIFKVWENLSCFEIDQFYSNWEDSDLLLNAYYSRFNPYITIRSVMEEMIKVWTGYICEPFDIRKIT